MNSAISFSRISLFVIAMSALIHGGHHGIVDDEIWSHVFKVLSDTEHGKKIIVDHPQPAYLVDAYTRVEPYAYHDNYHHHQHHDHHPAPIAYHGHHGPHRHLHAHPLPLHHHHHAPPRHYHHPTHDDHHHLGHGPEPVYRVPLAIPPVLDTYGPPHLHRHHKK